MGNVTCTFGGHVSHNYGWISTTFLTAQGIGYAGFGRTAQGNHRAIVLKITTPPLAGRANRKIQVNMPMCRSSAVGSGKDTFHYRITTTAPALSTVAMEPDFPTTYLCDGTVEVYSPSQYAGYAYNTLVLPAEAIQGGTTYYIWLWSDTPYALGSNSFIGYYAHHSTYGGTITVNVLYDDGSDYVYNGSKWLLGLLYVFTGTTWQRVTANIYNGSSWKSSSG